jgi:hypothetical protein
MAFTKLGAAMVAALATGALFASVAQAQQWDISGAKLASGSSAAASAKTTSVQSLSAKLLGSPFRIVSSGLESREAKIVQTGSGASGVSALVGKLVFTGLTVNEPAGCKTTGTIETVPLTGTAQMGNTEATKESVYVNVAPTSGEVVATFKIMECAIAGSYQLKGNFYLKANNPTGTTAVTQGGVTSGAINSSQGGALTIGKEAATLESSIDITLASGQQFALTKE